MAPFQTDLADLGEMRVMRRYFFRWQKIGDKDK